VLAPTVVNLPLVRHPSGAAPRAPFAHPAPIAAPRLTHYATSEIHQLAGHTAFATDPCRAGGCSATELLASPFSFLYTRAAAIDPETTGYVTGTGVVGFRLSVVIAGYYALPRPNSVSGLQSASPDQVGDTQPTGLDSSSDR